VSCQVWDQLADLCDNGGSLTGLGAGQRLARASVVTHGVLWLSDMYVDWQVSAQAAVIVCPVDTKALLSALTCLKGQCCSLPTYPRLPA
jgi:hypothetical protein